MPHHPTNHFNSSASWEKRLSQGWLPSQACGNTAAHKGLSWPWTRTYGEWKLGCCQVGRLSCCPPPMQPLPSPQPHWGQRFFAGTRAGCSSGACMPGHLHGLLCETEKHRVYGGVDSAWCLFILVVAQTAPYSGGICQGRESGCHVQWCLPIFSEIKSS